ncbi:MULTISPECIES: energy transducer TonB [Stenotrophomonas]|uniref:energy transducer TonB n=1 Tax=Stenotrophomonas sp. CFBP8994 TaxID=3096527 RepID=UPI002A6989D5|nr:energy transducer TonB [Stenotrophomonas sp. CFBP8994]MDY0979078.1 energy transducer TonB [Stenotrophomonas sp. CFBP8994]
MVRTHPPVVPLQIDVPRVLGWSTALALHLLALMLLLIPAAYVAAPLPRERTVVNLITPPVPQPEPPLPIPPQEPVPVRAPTATPRVAPLPLPTASADDVLAVPPLPASDVQTPTLAPVEPAPAASGDGAQLQYRTAPPPSYPIAAIRAGEQGTVTLRVQVDADGKPTSVSIERSSGSRALDHAARQQVLRNWRFVPAQVNGQAVPAVGLVPVSFSLPQ